jgi:hypothetical protein
MSTSTTSALAGAAALNLPIMVAGSAIMPPAALIASAAALAVLGAMLGWLVGWSFSGGRHELIELFPAAAEQEQRAA